MARAVEEFGRGTQTRLRPERGYIKNLARTLHAEPGILAGTRAQPGNIPEHASPLGHGRCPRPPLA
jgi:hypothetical protein